MYVMKKDYFHNNKRYAINTELHIIFYSYLLLVYFTQEYIYHETADRVVYVLLRKINSCNK